jgi:HprK-related kinase A
MTPDRWHEATVRVGPYAFLLRAPVRRIIDSVRHLYRDYPAEAPDGIFDFTVAVAPPNRLRRWFRPRVDLRCDVEIPFMAPQPLSHGVLALEMGMNLQIAAGTHRHLLLHAGAVARDDKALLLIGDSGAGKSTLSSVLGWSGWRFLGDEFALVDLGAGDLAPFPRPASLKNESAALLAPLAPADRFGQVFEGTIKGTIRHLLPPADAIAAMDRPASPRLIAAPVFAPGAAPSARRMGEAEAFTLLNQGSTNGRALGEAGFRALSRLCRVPAYEITYGSSADAQALLDRLWADV